MTDRQTDRPPAASHEAIRALIKRARLYKKVGPAGSGIQMSQLIAVEVVFSVSEDDLVRELEAALAQSPASTEPLREQLAALAHEQWTAWMRHLYSKCHTIDNGDFMVIPKLWWTRWLRQMDTRYADLSEREKESDRKEADRVLAVLRAQSPASEDVNEQQETRIGHPDVDPPMTVPHPPTGDE